MSLKEILPNCFFLLFFALYSVLTIIHLNVTQANIHGILSPQGGPIFSRICPFGDVDHRSEERRVGKEC